VFFNSEWDLEHGHFQYVIKMTSWEFERSLLAGKKMPQERFNNGNLKVAGPSESDGEKFKASNHYD